MLRLFHRTLLLALHVMYVGSSIPVPKGHLKPLGSHPALHSVTVMEDFPTPQYFYEWFVKASQPVLFRSVLNKIDFPAYKKWTDGYLREHFGQEEVTTERGKKETRRENDTFVWSFKSFLDQYHAGDLYMVADLTNKMKADIPMLPCLTCGGFQNALMMLVMWFSSGGTRSVLHFDSIDNINCLLDGSKDLIFIDKIHKHRVEAVDFVSSRGYSNVDIDKVDMLRLDKVDMLRFPQLENIPWIQAHMVKGDCLFIPKKWYHQVNSYGNRNLAVNVWFHHISWFNQSECENGENNSLKYMNEYSEASEEHENRLYVQERFEGLDAVYRDEMYRRMSDVSQEDVDQVFNFLDADSDDSISWEEFNTFDMKQLLKRHGKFFFPLDPSEAEIQQDKTQQPLPQQDDNKIKNNDEL